MFAGVPLGRHRPLLLSGILSRPLSPRTAAIRSSRIAAYLGFSGTSAPNTKPAPPPAAPLGGAAGRLGAHTPDQSGNPLIESQFWPRKEFGAAAASCPVRARNPQTRAMIAANALTFRSLLNRAGSMNGVISDSQFAGEAFGRLDVPGTRVPRNQG